MTPIIKKLLIGTGLAIVAGIVFGYNKVSQLQDQFLKIAIAPFGVKNLKIGIKQISFDLDVIFKNNSDQEFYVTGSAIATLSKLDIFYKENIIGSAITNLTEISIPAYGSMVLRNISVVVPTGVLLQNITNAADLLQNFRIIGYVDVLGTEYQIGE